MVFFADVHTSPHPRHRTSLSSSHVLVPQTTSPTLPYKAIKSRFPMSGRVVAGRWAAKLLQPSKGSLMTAIPNTHGVTETLRMTPINPQLER